MALFLVDSEPGTHLYTMGRISASLDPKDAFYHPWAWSSRQYTGATFSHWPGTPDGSAYDFAGSVFTVPHGIIDFSLLRYSAGTETMEESAGVEHTVKLEEDLLASLGYGLDVAKRWRIGVSAMQRVNWWRAACMFSVSSRAEENRKVS